MKLALGIAIVFVSCLDDLFGSDNMILIRHPDVVQYFRKTCPNYGKSLVDHFSEKHGSKREMCLKTAVLVSFTYVPTADALPDPQMRSSLGMIHQTISQPEKVSFIDSETIAEEYFVLSTSSSSAGSNDEYMIGLVQGVSDTDTVVEKHQAMEASFLASHTVGKSEEELKKLFKEGTSTPEAPLSRCARDTFTRFRLCSAIFPIWMQYKKQELPRVNYIKEGTGSCIKEADIVLAYFQFRNEPLIVNNLMPCAVNGEWDKPQFYIAADLRSQTAAFILELYSDDPIIPQFILRMHVKDLKF